jgi:hypothetical protein
MIERTMASPRPVPPSAGAAAVGAVEALEHVRQMVRLDATPRVADRQRYAWPGSTSSKTLDASGV